MAKKIAPWIIFLLSIIAGFFSWLSVNQAIKVPGSSMWLVPIICFSLLVILLFITITAIRNKYLKPAALSLPFFLSLIFCANIWHFLAIICGILLVFLAHKKIQSDIEFGKKISVGRSLKFGSKYAMMAVALVIASQYYFSVKDQPVENVLPAFDFSVITERIAPKLMEFFNPSLSAASMDTLTVDEFILKTQAEQIAKGDKIAGNPPSELINNITEEAKQNVLAEGRKKFSDMAGREVAGSEKVNNVLSETVNNKINGYFTPKNISLNSVPVIPVIALFIFITVFSIGSFLSLLLILAATGIFKLLLSLGAVAIVTETQEVEVIE